MCLDILVVTLCVAVAGDYEFLSNGKFLGTAGVELYDLFDCGVIEL